MKNSDTHQPIPQALVLVDCTCLPVARETNTNERGLFAFRELPAGTYTVQVLSGAANASKVIALSQGNRARVNFALNPDRSVIY